jgi:ATP-dependent RNA helicase DDX5/DBP2
MLKPTKNTVNVNTTKRKRSDSEDHGVSKPKTKVLASMSSFVMNAEKWRQEHSITVHGLSSTPTSYVCPDPMLRFSDTPFSKEFQDCLTRAGYTAPTPTQSQSWPIALAKQDMISVAKTGSGKTVGFLLPSFHHISCTDSLTAKAPRIHPRILVLAPTRELATQIDAEAKKFSRAKPHIRTTCVFGGAPKYPQIRQLEMGVDCLVATPGRLNDFVTMGKVNLSFVEILVLDEADRMLDMGFEPQIRSIVDVLPEDERRQTLLFSATWPKAIQKLAHALLRNPVQVNMGNIDHLQANQDICQTVDVCDEGEKPQKLIDLMDSIVQEYPCDISTAGATVTSTRTSVNTDVTQHVKTIVFFRTKRSCDMLAQEYWQHGYAVGALHGDKDQHERTRTMNQFKQGTIKLLFATDVAARGLDVKDVGIVINYDMPGGANGIEDYIHRIGRYVLGTLPCSNRRINCLCIICSIENVLKDVETE